MTRYFHKNNACINDFVGQEVPVRIFEKIIKNKNLQNIIICGPSNVGRTLYLQILLNKTNKKNNILYISLNSDRSIKNIRHSFKQFSISSLSDTESKIIIIDNFEILPNEIQYSLRRMIEVYSDKVRFLFITTTTFKIIEPILSRCITMFFNNLRVEDKKKILENNNCNKELIYDDATIDKYNINLLNFSMITNTEIKKQIYYDFQELVGLSPRELFQKLKNMKNGLINYNLFIESYIKWIISLSCMSSDDKLEIIRCSTLSLCNIINRGNPVINLSSLVFLLTKKTQGYVFS